MQTIQLTPELITEAKKFFPAQGFVKSEKPIAKHKSYNLFKEHYPNWPKLIYYIIMDEMFGQAKELDGNDAAYDVEFNIELVPDDLKPKPLSNG